MGLIHILLLTITIVPLVLGATSVPTPIQPDPTYQTGISTVLSSKLSWSNTYTISYNSIMSTSSLNASFGIYGIDYDQRNKKHGFRTSIASLDSSSMQIYVKVNNYQ